MPYYDYGCDNKECTNVQEEKHGMQEDPKIKCSICNSDMSKEISGSMGVKFVGDGFFVNDYKDK
jgi:putative FmdB family regulatory protein